MLPDTQNILFDELHNDLLADKKVRLTMARLDKIHPVVSGNKLFKLHYFLTDALQSAHKTICTFGGAYSNHLVATAFACKETGLKSIGIVRGDDGKDSHTLVECIKYGMELHFVPRGEYKQVKVKMNLNQGNYTVVPEGGYHPTGAKGAALIMNATREIMPSHVCTATGTATTLAGLIRNRNRETILSVPVIKNMTDINERINYLNGNTSYMPLVLDEYHFGGYTKRTTELLDFMNSFYKSHHIATDFVYTGKMMFAVFDKIKKGFFPEGSHIVCLHTGGLQGNLSLPGNSLIF